MAEELTIAVLLILLLLWLAVLAPPLVRYLSGERQSVDSVGTFNQTLSVLGRTNGHAESRGRDGSALVRSATDAQRRRRDVLLALVGAVAGSLGLAMFAGGPLLWGLQVLADALLAAYLVLLLQFKHRTLERETKVHYLPARPSPTREPALRRTASR